MTIALLGPLHIDGGEVLEPRDRVALEVLVVRRNQVVSPDQLADAIWGAEPPSSWVKQVQICISRLRKVLGPKSIETVAGGYRLLVDDTDLDTCRFEEHIVRSRGFSASGEPDRAAASYARAFSLWRGDPYADLDGWAPGRIETDRFLELRRSAQEEWMEARLAAGDHRAVAVEAMTLVAEEPLRERRWHTLALAQYRCGRQADALRALNVARTTLLDELGIDPGQDLVELEEAILRQDPALSAVADIGSVSEACPYKGLAPYAVDDVAWFFGRDHEVAECIERLGSTPLLVLAGSSGSGKSSLARAGLVAALDRPKRPVVVLNPGRDPEAALTAAIASTDPAPVLVVDQLEEVFTLDVAKKAVSRFFDRLASYAAESAPLVIVIRSDYLGGLTVSADLSRLVEQGLYLVAPMSGAALRAAIEQPAAQAGLRLEHGLVDLLERDTEGEPGSLPLLSHALAETWRRRDGQVLTVEGYRASGGIRGAVAHSADRLYDSLDAERQAVLRSLLLTMVSSSYDGPPVRRRIPARSIIGDPHRDRVMSLLVRSRLVTAEEDSYELAHEALARAWPRLQSWLEDDAEGQRIMRHLATRADDWDSMGRPDGELYKGARLEAALEWRGDVDPGLTDVETEFLEASAALFASERALSSARARRDARQNRRLRALVVATGVFLVAALIGVGMASSRRHDVQVEALVNQSLSIRSTDRAAAALLAVEAFRRSPDSRSWSALLATFTGSPGFMGYRYVPGADWLAGALVPGTSKALVAPNGRDLQVHDLATGQVESRIPGSGLVTGEKTRLAVSDDGSLAVRYATAPPSESCQTAEAPAQGEGTGCAVVEVYDIETGARVMFSVAPFDVGQVAINRDGSLVAVTGGFDGDLAIYRTRSGELVGTVPGLGPLPASGSVWNVAGVGFGPDGLVYLGSMAGPIRAIDPESVEVLDVWEAPPLSSNNHLFVAPNGLVFGAGTHGLVALDSRDGSQLWDADLQDGRHPEPCPWFVVNVSRAVLYCGNFYGVIEERSLITGSQTGNHLDPQQGSVGPMGISEDGNELFVFGAESPTVSSWRFDGSGLVQRLIADGHVVYDGYSTSGESVLVARRGATTANWDEFDDFAVWDPLNDLEVARTGLPLEGTGWAGSSTLVGYLVEEEAIAYFDAESMERVEGLHVPISAVNLFLSAGGEWLYVTFEGGVIWTVDPRTRQRVEPTLRISGLPMSVSATSGGERVLVTTWDDGGTVITVFAGDTGRVVAERRPGSSLVAVSLDGRVVGASGGAITEYDLETLEPLGSFPAARGDVNTLQFSRDGTVLLAGSNDQTVSLYDVATRRRIGDVIATFSPFIGPGNLRPDGREIAVNQRQGVVLWDIDPGHLVDAACQMAGRNLSSTEWTTYLAGFGGYRSTCPQYVGDL